MGGPQATSRPEGIRGRRPWRAPAASIGRADEALRSERNQHEPPSRKASERLADCKAPGIDTDRKLPALDGEQAELLEASNASANPAAVTNA